jgi:hypothetical protein
MPIVNGNKDIDAKPSPRVKLYVPDLPIVYKANKVFQLLQRIDRQMAKNPTYIPIKDYLYLVVENEKINEELIKRGLNTSNGRAKARMEQQKLDRISNKKSASGVGKDKSVSVDNGVSTSNPFA